LHNLGLIISRGGREALESLLTRLGAVSSLESLNGQSLYEMLLSLPDRDPEGDVAPGIYRTLIESNVLAEESPHRDNFLKAGKMFGQFKEAKTYLPVAQLRYNANITVAKEIATYVPLVDIPRRKNTSLVKQLFGITSLTSKDVQLELISAETEYDLGSEDAYRHLQTAIPFIYAIRLSQNLDENGRVANLLKRAVLSVCSKTTVSAKLPDNVTQVISLNDQGAHIVIDNFLVIVWEYIENNPGFLTFWLIVAELVAELLGVDVADEVGGILRCHTAAEMLEVVQARLGTEADEKIAEAQTRFDDLLKHSDVEKEIPVSVPEYPTSKAPEVPLTSSEKPDQGAGTSEPIVDKPHTDVRFEPTLGPMGRLAKRRKITITAFRGEKSNRGPIATEPVTFRVVEAFEKQNGRFVIPVSHLHGADAFGCDLLSVDSEEVLKQVNDKKAIADKEIIRYIEVKGRSNRTGQVELTDNEYRAAESQVGRYFIYRVFVDRNHPGQYEIAILSNPLSSEAVRHVTRFDLVEGSGAIWFKCLEQWEDQEVPVK
jgi:hypothetical protein